LQQIFTSYTQFFQVVRDKNTTIGRLRNLLFGPSSEKTDQVVGDTPGTSERRAPAGADAAPDHRIQSTAK
jgi:hypothetical protein